VEEESINRVIGNDLFIITAYLEAIQPFADRLSRFQFALESGLKGRRGCCGGVECK